MVDVKGSELWYKIVFWYEITAKLNIISNSLKFVILLKSNLVINYLQEIENDYGQKITQESWRCI